MQTIIRYPNAQRVEALVLSIGRFTIRVVPRHSADTIELRLSQGQWTDENGAPIDFEAFVAAADVDISNILDIPLACAAAS